MPIFTAIATAIAGGLALAGTAASTFISVTAWALEGIASLGASLALQAIAGKPQAAKFSVKGTLQSGGDVPRSIILGYTATAGSLVYANYWGNSGKTKNAFLTWVIAVCDLPGATPVGLWVNDTKATLPDMSGTAPTQMGWPVTEFHKKGKDYLWIKYYDGTQTAADSFLMSKVASTDRPYGSDRVGYGVCYFIITARVNQKLFSGFPTFKFEMNGIPLYNITKDSTMGGSGLQRWNDPSTWGGDGDLLTAVQLYNILRGLQYNGEWFYGLQNMTANRLPAANWIAAINKCRTTMTVNGVDLPTYRSGGEFAVNSQPKDAVDSLTVACSGRISTIAGTFKLFVGAPEAAAWNINDDVFLSTEERTFRPFLTLDKTVNAITGTYPEPAENWASKPTPPLYNATYEGEDGNRRLPQNISFELVPYIGQVQYLMQSALAEARRARSFTGTLGPEYWGIEPNDVVSFDSVVNGFSDKLFRVDGVVDNPNCTIQCIFTEVDPTDFDPAEFVYQDPNIVPLIPSVPASQVITGWDAAAVNIVDADGVVRRPGIEIFYDGDLDNIEFVRIQIRLAGTTALLYDNTVPYGEVGDDNSVKSSVVSFAAILPLTAYEWRGILIPFGQSTDALWSNESEVAGEIVEGAWLTITTTDARLGRADLYDGIIDVTALSGDVKDLQASFASSARSLWEMASQIALLTADQDFGGFDSAQAIVQQVMASSNGVSVAVQDAIAAATGPDSAIGAAVIAINGATDAGDFGSATFQMVSGYTPATGWDNKIGIQVRGTDGGDFVDAGIFLEAKNGGGGSRILIDADQIILVNPGYEAQPFAFVGGVLTMTATAVDIITAGLLQNQAGTFIIDLDAGNIEIWSA